MKKKNSQLGIRLDEDLLSKLRDFESDTGMPPSALVRALIEAALEYYEKEKHIIFPIACIAKKDLPKIKKNDRLKKSD